MRAAALWLSLLVGCAGARVASYEAAQDACIVQAASMDAGSAEKNAAATTCRCKVKEQYGRSCDGGAK